MIIGLVGPLCSGKDSFSKILLERGFECFSLGDVLREEMKSAGQEITRESIQKFANNLREKEGSAIISQIIISKMRKDKSYLVQGFRNPEEIKEFRKLNDFFLVSLDSSVETRFERMKLRKREKDPENFQEFKKIDDMELLGTNQEKHGFNIQECMKMAEKKIVNDGDFEDLKNKVGQFLDSLNFAKV